jgi:catechol 2,3-dioxygenase-like lactoylglutathione lyase family enzyme
VLDHVGVEVEDLGRSARFYDAVFFALGGRRTFQDERAIAYGMTGRTFWIRRNGDSPANGGSGHIALRASGKAAVDAAHAAGLAHGGADDGSPGPRPHYGRRYYAAYLRDPDGVRLEVVAGSQ